MSFIKEHLRTGAARQADGPVRVDQAVLLRGNRMGTLQRMSQSIAMSRHVTV